MLCFAGGVVPDFLLLRFWNNVYPLLSLAAARGDITIAKLLIDAGADVNERFFT